MDVLFEFGLVQHVPWTWVTAVKGKAVFEQKTKLPKRPQAQQVNDLEAMGYGTRGIRGTRIFLKNEDHSSDKRIQERFLLLDIRTCHRHHCSAQGSHPSRQEVPTTTASSGSEEPTQF